MNLSRAKLAAAFVLAVAIFAGGFVVCRQTTGEKRGGPTVAPGEYVYLDNDRVRAYLGQLDGGLSANEERSVTESRKLEGGVNVPRVSVSGSTERDTYVKRVVTPDDADRFYMLRNDLDSHGWLKRLNAERPAEVMRDVATLRAGDFVQIDGARLRIPSFAAVFAKANYASQMVAPGQRRVPQRLLGPISSTTRGALADYIHHVGRDPRLPFRMTIGIGGGSHVRVLMPLRASRLGYQPGIASGVVHVIAKVIRNLPAPPGDVTREARLKSAYLDFDTFTSFGRALQQADPAVMQRLDIVPGDPTRGIRAVVSRAARVTGPGLVLLTIAVYQ
jgi:hypothetical protein